MHVGLHVVNADQRFAEAPAQRLRRGEPDEQAADHAGAVGDGDRVEVVGGHVRIAQRLLDDRQDAFGVRAARDFGHHAAEARMQLDLRMHDVAEHLVAIAHHGRRRLIARSFDA